MIKKYKQSGYTLVEMLTVIAISTILMAGIFALLSFSNQLNLNEYSRYRSVKSATYIRNYIVSNEITGKDTNIFYDVEEHTMNMTFIDTTDGNKEKTITIARDLNYESASIKFYKARIKKPVALNYSYNGVTTLVNRYVANTWCSFTYRYNDKDYNILFIVEARGQSYFMYRRNIDGSNGDLLFGMLNLVKVEPVDFTFNPVFNYNDSSITAIDNSQVEYEVDNEVKSIGESVSYLPNLSSYKIKLKNIDASATVDEDNLNVFRVEETLNGDGTKNITIYGTLSDTPEINKIFLR